MKVAFLTVTDRRFFPGTLATVNSVLSFHPDADVWVVGLDHDPLTDPQLECLRSSRQVRWIPARELSRPGRYLGPWETKAHAAADLAAGCDILVGIDSDCLLCGPVSDEILACVRDGGMAGGSDGDGMDYDDAYRAYGINAPIRNPRYMSTSLFFCAVDARNGDLLRRWSQCCDGAVFNGRGSFPGHGDQGVLNAVLFAVDGSQQVRLLPNELWSQHWVYWETRIDFQDGRFINLSAGGHTQRAFHCGGTDKFWDVSHRERILGRSPLQVYPYVWFLSQLFFGPCRRWDLDPCLYLPSESHHLLHDLVLFLPQIFQVVPEARGIWESLTDVMIDRALADIPRALSLGGGSLSEIFELIEARPDLRRFVEIGSYEGGAILALALRFAHRDLDFFAVESFLGNLDGTMDGHPLPRRISYSENLARFPSLRVTLVPGDSRLAASHFRDASLDMIFVDACHDTPAVLADIAAWLPKLAPRALLAGDDYGWPSVRAAVDAALGPDVRVTPSGCVWWCQPAGA